MAGFFDYLGALVSFNLDEQAGKFAQEAFGALHTRTKFVAGETTIPVTGKVFGQEEISAAVRASADFWLTSGPNVIKYSFNALFMKFITKKEELKISVN